MHRTQARGHLGGEASEGFVGGLVGDEPSDDEIVFPAAIKICTACRHQARTRLDRFDRGVACNGVDGDPSFACVGSEFLSGRAGGVDFLTRKSSTELE